MFSKKEKVALTDAQKVALCAYAQENKMTQAKYVDWIEKQWSIRIDKTKILVKELGVLPETLQFLYGWLQKFKERNGIHQLKLQGEAALADDNAIINALSLLKSNWMLQQVEIEEQAEELKMNVLQVIQFIIQSWKEINSKTIYNSVLANLSKMLKNIKFSDLMQAEEFLTIIEENITYEVPKNNQAIEELVEIFINECNLEYSDTDKIDDSLETPIITFNKILKGLETIHLYLLQYENTSEHLKLVDKIKKVIREKKINTMQQAMINSYFS
ncbi:4928_t:CDS:2 [Cetraspora pellucida]|uniref:4928_t:CDS:1 n=1 Tax=Cetraspora pellucida TaxID=1433469 RepID=A0A9N9HPC4_9GLOM|nr:4928_t:CDS:2 [Cetraspora pellucida]